MGVAYVCTSTSGIDQMLVSHFFIGKQIMLKGTFSTTNIEIKKKKFDFRTSDIESTLKKKMWAKDLKALSLLHWKI